MKQSNADIGSLLNDKLQQYSTEVTFDSVWDRHERKNKKFFGVKRVAVIPIIALLTLFTMGFAAYGIIRISDNVDYPFVDDQRVIGKWESVDFVDKIEQFKPDKKAYGDELYLTTLVFIDEGDMLTAYENGNLMMDATSTWTNGLILDKQYKTASKYDIKEIYGETYMFLEWKSGDYTFRGMKPNYYVLRKTDSEKYTNTDEQRIEDKIDYPFVNDPEILGSWQSVDFIADVEDFEPYKKSWIGDLYFSGFDILEDGEINLSINPGSASQNVWVWTKGLILHKQDKTASEYEIKEIDGETYMIFEWKSGDYIYGRKKHGYYVLKKVE